MKRTDDRGKRAPKKAADGKPVDEKAAAGRVPARAVDSRAPKKAADGRASTRTDDSRTPTMAADGKAVGGKTVDGKTVGGRALTKAASAPAPKKSRSAPSPKKSAEDRSLKRALDDRAALEALADRSLESLVAEYAPKDRSLNNIDAIVAPRTTDPTVNLVPGARVRQCALCHEDIWVAPSSFAAFKGRTMPPLWCAECAMMWAELNSPLKRRPPGRA